MDFKLNPGKALTIFYATLTISLLVTTYAYTSMNTFLVSSINTPAGKLTGSSGGGIFPPMDNCNKNCPNGVTVECGGSCPVDGCKCSGPHTHDPCRMCMGSEMCTAVGIQTGGPYPNQQFQSMLLAKCESSSVDVGKVLYCCLWAHEYEHICQNQKQVATCRESDAENQANACMKKLINDNCNGAPPRWANSICQFACEMVAPAEAYMPAYEKCMCDHSAPAGSSSSTISPRNVIVAVCCECYEQCKETPTSNLPQVCIDKGWVPAKGAYDSRCKYFVESDSGHSCKAYAGISDFSVIPDCCEQYYEIDWEKKCCIDSGYYRTSTGVCDAVCHHAYHVDGTVEGPVFEHITNEETGETERGPYLYNCDPETQIGYNVCSHDRGTGDEEGILLCCCHIAEH